MNREKKNACPSTVRPWRRAQRLKQIQVRLGEQPVAAELVDQFDGADALVLDAHGGAQDGERRKPGLFVHGFLEIGVGGHVADDLSGVLLYAATDDALVALQRQAGDFRRPDTGLAVERLSRLVEQEQGAAGGADVPGDAPDRPQQGFLDIPGGREVQAHVGEQLERIGDALSAVVQKAFNGLTITHGATMPRMGGGGQTGA